MDGLAGRHALAAPDRQRFAQPPSRVVAGRQEDRVRVRPGRLQRDVVVLTDRDEKENFDD